MFDNILAPINTALMSAPGTFPVTATITGGTRPSLGEPVSADEFGSFFDGVKTLATALMGIFAITALIFFIISLTKLSTSAGNEQGRARAIKGILFSGIALALFGGATALVGVAWGMF